jgi:hypothetical protein
MAVKERTPDRLREQSKHLLYGIQMLFALGHDLRAGDLDAAVAALPRAGLPIRNAVIEAFEIHARQLIEFLTHQRNASSATAREWARGWSVSAEEVQELKDLRAALSERVAHLSWKRSEFPPAQQLVLTHEIEDKLRPLILRFLWEADHATLCEDFVVEAYLAVGVASAASGPLSLAELGYGSPVGSHKVGTTAGTATQALSETAEQLRPRP